MQDIQIVQRHRTPFPKPQAIAAQGPLLWIGSIETLQLYALDPATFDVKQQIAMPGKPWGMIAIGADLRVLCGVSAEDQRLIYTVHAGEVQPNPLPAPDDTGSHLGYDGEHLYVSQWYRRKLVVLDPQGHALRDYDAPHGIAGHVIVGPYAFLLCTDDEAQLPFVITRLHLETGIATDIATVPYFCRGLAHDGTHFWSNIREQGETIAFALPG